VKAFTYDALPGRVRFGIGAVGEVPDELAALGGRRVLVITDPQVKSLGDHLAAAIGDRLAGRFDEVRQHVPEELAARAVAVARDVAADSLLTVGGGSATGLGKAVALETGVPILAVPTTYAGSEMTPIYGITGERKRTGRDLRVLPKVVVYDPALTVGLPPEVTGPSGFNALAHCVEALYAPGTSPVIALLAEEGIRALGRSLPPAVGEPENLDARSDVLYGAYLAGAALAVAGTALHHKLCHVLGGSFGLVHADVNAVILPHAAAYNAPAVPEAFARVAAALGGPADAGVAGALLYDLAGTIGAPTSLAAIGMPAAGLATAAEQGAQQAGTGNPRPVDLESLRRLLDDAYAGRRPA
jgi:maleylacetate reductase